MAETISTNKETEKTEARVAAVRIVVACEEDTQTGAACDKMETEANGKAEMTELKIHAEFFKLFTCRRLVLL